MNGNMTKTFLKRLTYLKQKAKKKTTTTDISTGKEGNPTLCSCDILFDLKQTFLLRSGQEPYARCSSMRRGGCALEE